MANRTDGASAGTRGGVDAGRRSLPQVVYGLAVGVAILLGGVILAFADMNVEAGLAGALAVVVVALSVFAYTLLLILDAFTY